MALPAADDHRVHESLRNRILELDDAEHVIGGPDGSVLVVCREGGDREELRRRLEGFSQEGEAPGESPRIEILVRPRDEPRRRVRLGRVEKRSEGVGLVGVRVTLEWSGSDYVGESSGESSHHIELRTAGAAAVAALNRVTGDKIRFRLVGVKLFRAFDADLLVIALMSEQNPPQKLVGAVLVGADPHRAAASAVLHATNRVLGNYIAVG
jgi:hypothetical protein